MAEKHPTEKVGRNPQLATVIESDNQVHTNTEATVSNTNQSVINRVLSLPGKAVSKFKRLNLHYQLAICLAILLAVIAFFAFVIGGNSNEQAKQEETTEFTQSTSEKAKITRIDGTLQLKNNDGVWEDTKISTELSEGSVVRTVGATSRAIVEFTDGSQLRLDANSEIELMTLTTERIVIRQVSGYSFNRLLAAPNRAYVVETEDAQYEALGTAFKVATSGDEQAVEVYHNSVHETSTNKRPGEGEKLIVVSNARPSESDTIKKIDIEALKQDSFIKWNRDIDLASDAFKNDLGFLSDFDAPPVTVSSPVDNEVILLESDASEGTVEIKGSTEKGATLTVQSKSQANSSPITVSVGSDGNFTTPVLSAPLGTSVFSFIAKDKTGNTTELSVRYTFQRKSAPVESGAVLLSGEKSSNDKVSLKWTLSGDLKAPDGYRVVYGESKAPTLESADDVQAIQSGKTAEIDGLSNNKTYYFRVCIFNKDTSTCSNYSNEITIKL